MSRVFQWLCLAPPLFVFSCADIWQFKDFEAKTNDAAVSGDAVPDSTVPDTVGSAVVSEAGEDNSLADVDGSIVTDSGDSGRPQASDDAPGNGTDAACPDACPLGAVCDNGACACRDAPNLCGAACVDLATDPVHCGSCTAAPCPSGASCIGRVCVCPAAQPTACGNGCVDIKTDHANCNGCGTACPAASACHKGMCTVCGTVSTDQLCSGICVDVSSDVKNCGGCKHECAIGATCVSGACICPAGTPNTCGAVAGDAGACVDIATDRNDCGGCGNSCKLAHATSGCSSASCVIVSCIDGYADCDKAATDGCEIHTAADPNHCGACANICNLAHATSGCVGSTCTVAACAAGFGNCDGIALNGCEINTRTDRNNCGACSTATVSHACSVGRVCRNGSCACEAGMHECSGTCVSDNSMSVNLCGTMCTPCPLPKNGTANCSGAPPVCGVSCSNLAFPTPCGNACVNTLTDGNNCGGCGAMFACASGLSCVGGVCTLVTDGGSDAAGE